MGASRAAIPVTTDAVVVVPGIMGSELVDETGEVCWGLKPSLLAKAWLTKRLDVLRVTDADQAGGRRLRPTRLLRVPGYMPVLGGMEPYTYLLRRVAERAVDPRAVTEFPYDWRLSLSFNAAELVRQCEQHLAAWRQVVADQRYADPAEVRLVVVAHSMGGLITRYAIEELGMSELLRQVITLGTPFYGAVKAVRILSIGEGVPLLPRAAARDLAATCPGVHDLLPRYRCVSRNDRLDHLGVADVVGLGGDKDLAEAAAAQWTLLRLVDEPRIADTVQHHAVVGTEQATAQSLSIEADVPGFLESLNGVDHGGDSTVYRAAAGPPGISAVPLPQKHGTLARSPEAVGFVADKLVGADAGPPLGTRKLRADIPDIVAAGEPVTVLVRVADRNPIGVSVTSTSLDSGVPTEWGPGVPGADALRFARAGLPPGLHRVQVKAGGYSGVSDILLVSAAP
jgi:hypothetical protein